MGLVSCIAAVATMPVSASAEALQRLASVGPDGTDTSNFTHIGSAAVDQQDGSVYVLDAGGEALYKFQNNGQQLNFGGLSPYISGNRIEGVNPYTVQEVGRSAVAQVAVNPSSHRVYITEQSSIRAFEPDGEPAKFTAGPGAGTSEIPGFTKLFGVGVDISGNIYASDYSGTVHVFAPTGAPLVSFPADKPRNLAVSPAGEVLVLDDSGAIKRFRPDIFPVTGSTTYSETTAVPNDIAVLTAGFAIDPVSQDIYVMRTDISQASVGRYDESGTLIEIVADPSLGGSSQGIAVLGNEIELQEKESVKFYVGDNGEFNDSQLALFCIREVVDAPDVSDLHASKVTADSAVLNGAIDPNLKATTFRFEYGLGDCSVSVCAAVPVGGGTAGEGSEPVVVARHIQGLVPETTYHYRLVAENELGTDQESGTFTTQALGAGFELVDKRVWEMVSPPAKHGAELQGSASGVIQAASDGNALAYLSIGSIEATPEGNRSIEKASVLARRAAFGWQSRDLTPANHRTVPLGVGTGSEYKLFTPDLTRSILEPRDGTQLSPDASERTPYLRENLEPPIYTPLLTGKEGVANVPPGTQFGGDENVPAGPVQPIGATPNFSHVALRSSVPLAVEAAGPALYLWSAGQLSVISVQPIDEGGEVITGTLGSGAGSVWNAISKDGTRAFWGSGAYNALGALYLRDMESKETVRLDVAQPGASGAGVTRPAFQGASEDGTVVIFKDSRQLTEDASPDGSDLYRCEIPPGDSDAGCTVLSNLTGAAAGGESADVLGVLAGMSEDATAAYFVARGILDSTPNQRGDSAVSGEPNLYLWQQGAGVRFIATLAEQDSNTWGVGAAGGDGLAFRVNADASEGGRYLSFMSQRSLTGQFNLKPGSGEAVQQVFRYDAVADDLDCLSCSPFGAAPEAEMPDDFSLVDPNGQYEGLQVAGALPAATRSSVGGISLYRPRTALDNGRVFFNAFDSLVPADSNGEWDVYEYEPAGVGDCSASFGTPTTVRSAGGCVSLLSSGTAEGEVGFLDASASGDDAFFLTPARLSVADGDGQLDVYDARVDGVPATLAPPSNCLGAACRPPAQPPGDAALGSANFRGHGNVRTGRNCGAMNRRVGKLNLRAQRLRRGAMAAESAKAAVRMRDEARQLTRKAKALSKQVERCRRDNRRASR